MRRSLIVAAISAAAWCAGALGPIPVVAGGLEGAAKRVADAVVLVEARGRGLTRTGTGFLLEGGRFAVTALHTLEGAREIRVSVPGRMASVAVRLRAASAPWDLAILDLPPANGQAPCGMAVPGAAEEVPVGAEVAVTGYAGTFDGEPWFPLTFRGIVSGRMPAVAGTSLLLLDVQAREGLSGSPVYSTLGGELVGVLTRLMREREHSVLGGAAPVSALAELLREAGGTVPTAPDRASAR